MAEYDHERDPVTSAVTQLRCLVVQYQSTLSSSEFKEFCRLTTALFSDFEKNILKELEEAYRVCDQETFDEIRGNIARQLATRDWSKTHRKRNISTRDSAKADSDVIKIQQPSRKYKETKEAKEVTVPDQWDRVPVSDLTVKQMSKILKDNGVKGFCRGTREQLESELNKLRHSLASLETQKAEDSDLGLDAFLAGVEVETI